MDGCVLFRATRPFFLPPRASEGRKEGEAKGWSKKSGERRGKKVEEARGDGSAGVNHLVCIHLRRILFLPARSLGFLLLFLLFFFFLSFLFRDDPLSRDSSPHAKTDDKREEKIIMDTALPPFARQKNER